ncbi:MAG: hypothetical protein FK733_10440 [Asgard group archaeon]|nr:hypothetical protein [Asgard group archaeon]
MPNVNLIFNAIAIPLSSIATILIISKNRRNITNILLGLAAFLGGVLTPTFELLKELYFSSNINLAIFFAKMTYLSILIMTIPTLSFSIFFWRAKYKKIPRFLHFLVGIPAFGLGIWLFLDNDVVELTEINLGINNVVELPFAFTAGAIMFLVFVIFVLELFIMTRRAKSFPQLRRRMIVITVGFGVGLFLAFLSIFIFQPLFTETLQPTSIFIIVTAVTVLSALSGSLSKGKMQVWHGCPKLHRENNCTAICMNAEEGTCSVNVLDLGEIIERVQLDTNILKTGPGNCANTIFSDEKGIVRCLTTHLPIKVLDQEVTREEIELARDMDIMNGNELCADCLHKIIAYRKEHTDKSDSEIKLLFLGIRAEEFFGIT